MTVFGLPARVFFYFGSSKSFVSTSFTLHGLGEHKLVVMTLLGEHIVRISMFRSCKILIEGVVLKANLIFLELWDFDVIMGIV